MKLTRCFLAALAALAVTPLLAAGTPPAPPGVAGERVLATVGTARITVADFQAEMARGAAAGLYDKPEQRRALLDEMVRFEVLLAKAQQEGLDRDPDVLRVYHRMMVTKYQQRQLAGAEQAVRVSDDEVKAFYNAHVAEYARPARYQAAIVYVAVPKTAKEDARAKLRQRADQALAAAQALPASVTSFGTVAKDFSDDQASRYRGGVVGWLIRHEGQRYKWDKRVLDAVFALQPGQIGPVVEAPDGFYLVRLVGKEDASPQPLERLAAGIRERLLRDKREAIERDLYQRLFSEVGVKVEPQLVDALQPPSRVPPAPPPLPAH